MTEELYYAKGLQVWKAPQKTKVEGGTSFVVGFPVCTVSEYIGEEGAISCAALLNLGEQAQTPAPENRVVLAPKHTGMKVDYRGLISQARRGLHRDPGIAEMLRQFEEHLTELGQRWYAGDATVVDELLQLYCIEIPARAALAAEGSAE